MKIIMEAHWKYLVENDDQIRKLLRRINFELEDELYTNVVLARIERLLELYNPDKGLSLKAYVYHSIWAYCYKYLAKKRKEEARLQNLEDVATGNYSIDSFSYSEENKLISKEQVLYLIRQLGEYHSSLLVMYHMWGYTFDEIAGHLDTSKSTVYLHYHIALERAREITRHWDQE